MQHFATLSLHSKHRQTSLICMSDAVVANWLWQFLELILHKTRESRALGSDVWNWAAKCLITDNYNYNYDLQTRAVTPRLGRASALVL